MFDMTADPEGVAARAAELSLEQLERFRHMIRKNRHISQTELALVFYKDPFEISISNRIGTLMAGYAVVKGYVTEAEASR